MEVLKITHHPANAGRKFSALVEADGKKTSGWGNTEEEAKDAAFSALQSFKK